MIEKPKKRFKQYFCKHEFELREIYYRKEIVGCRKCSPTEFVEKRWKEICKKCNYGFTNS